MHVNPNPIVQGVMSAPPVTPPVSKQQRKDVGSAERKDDTGRVRWLRPVNTLWEFEAGEDYLKPGDRDQPGQYRETPVTTKKKESHNKTLCRPGGACVESQLLERVEVETSREPRRSRLP